MSERRKSKKEQRAEFFFERACVLRNKTIEIANKFITTTKKHNKSLLYPIKESQKKSLLKSKQKSRNKSF